VENNPVNDTDSSGLAADRWYHKGLRFAFKTGPVGFIGDKIADWTGMTPVSTSLAKGFAKPFELVADVATVTNPAVWGINSVSENLGYGTVFDGGYTDIGAGFKTAYQQGGWQGVQQFSKQALKSQLTWKTFVLGPGSRPIYDSFEKGDWAPFWEFTGEIGGTLALGGATRVVAGAIPKGVPGAAGVRGVPKPGPGAAKPAPRGTGRDFVIPGRSVPHRFEARLMDGSNTLEVIWTDSLRQTAGRLQQVQQLAGGPGSFSRITGRASADLEAAVRAGQFNAQQAAHQLGNSLGGRWRVDVTRIPGTEPPQFNVTAVRIGD
jgi:hypothetical protein